MMVVGSAGRVYSLRMLKKAFAVAIVVGAILGVVAYLMYLGNAAPTAPVIAAADIATAGKPIVVKLHAQWCPKCMVTKGVWANLEQEYAGRVHLLVMDFTDEESTQVSRKEAQRLGLDRFVEEFSGATGIVVVLHPRTKEVAAELEFSRDLAEYRAAIDAALAAAK
jgi:thiol-disulfide isomerase/thioredoxin